jgi:hypothetical protein
MISIMKSLIRKSFALTGCVAALGCLSGCDNILGIDNLDAPTSVLSGRVVYNGQPLGLRSNGVSLELWQTDAECGTRCELNQKIPVQVDYNGNFRALVFDGSYKLNSLPNNGPWASKPDTIRFDVSGDYTTDFTVTPHYTVLTPTYVRGAPTTAAPGGTVTATFKVGRVDTSKALELVGIYVGTTAIVDRTNSLTIANNLRERTLAQVTTQVTNNQDISITVTLPPDIYNTSSPYVREYVFVRVGVKTAGIAELLYSPAFKLNL